jgi:putative ATP-dependent endonuclease of the OLD family
MIKKIFIKNYKIFNHFDLELNEDLNIIVGDNEVGKSTILEAINIGLTKRLNGRFIEYELSHYLFNRDCVNEYLKSLRENKPIKLPEIVIELYFYDANELEVLRGSMNSKKENCIGIKVEIIFDDDFKDEYENLITNSINEVHLIPAEFYKVQWHSFANDAITFRSLPVRLSYIDATTIRLQSGTDFYLQDIIQTDLDVKERVNLNIAYRYLREQFSHQESIKGINERLSNKKGAISEKDLSISIDISQKSNWETNLIPHLDGLPFQLIGKGEQNALKIMLALEHKASDSNIILIEEPENHLSFSSMNKLISKIREKCGGKQIIITTHSGYVLNKLGIENLILLYGNDTTTLKNLPNATKNYFKKLSGYDTLRLILAKKSILVEGPSDELIVQKAYLNKYNKLPIENGIDVINVRGLSFSRFLDIAKELKKEVVIVTDNDGDFKTNIDRKYENYKKYTFIKIFRSENNLAPTLEPQIAECNDLNLLNKIFETSNQNKASMKKYMESNKTECALKIFETKENILLPEYIINAVEQE